jgi:hypothetical protein
MTEPSMEFRPASLNVLSVQMEWCSQEQTQLAVLVVSQGAWEPCVPAIRSVACA